MKLFAILLLSLVGIVWKQIVEVPGGMFTPQYGISSPGEKFQVSPFRIDTVPVTNERFYAFVKERPEWRKEHVSPLMVDQNYVKHWVNVEDDLQPTTAQLHSPVVNISWFAANDFCVAQGGRLPSVLEWEYVAAASETKPNASTDPVFVQKLLEWYSTPHPFGKLPEVGSGVPNYWGIYDLHGVIWEWTSDFNSVFVAGDNRRDGEQLKNLFCGNSAASAADRANYAAFMRYALRNSLRANYTMETLGFRCAYNRKE